MKIYRLLAKGSATVIKILKHPFNQQLANGTLSPQVFKLYLEQDALYLYDFARALHLLSQRLEDQRHAREFKCFSKEILNAEMNLHIRYLGKSTQSMTFFRTSLQKPIKKIPVISQYTQHLIETATRGTLEEAVLSCIPCFWIYRQLGLQMSPSQTLKNPFHLWISSYSSPRFERSTSSLLSIANELIGHTTCPQAQNVLLAPMLKSLYFELQFFDSVMALENNLSKDFIHPTSTLTLPK